MSKEKKETKVKAVKKDKKQIVQTHKPVEVKKVQLSKRQRDFAEKKAKLAVAGRQTKWAPVWVVMKKYGKGKRIHPASTTKYRRSWRRTKLHIKPRKIRKWHLG